MARSISLVVLYPWACAYADRSRRRACSSGSRARNRAAFYWANTKACTAQTGGTRRATSSQKRETDSRRQQEADGYDATPNKHTGRPAQRQHTHRSTAKQMSPHACNHTQRPCEHAPRPCLGTGPGPPTPCRAWGTTPGRTRWCAPPTRARSCTQMWTRRSRRHTWAEPNSNGGGRGRHIISERYIHPSGP